jgi:hypothetical protein
VVKLKLQIDAEAVALIKEEGGHVVISSGQGGGCRMIGSVMQAQADPGKPDRPLDQFRVIEVDGATVYLDKELDADEGEYRLHVTRFMGHKNLAVSYEGS